jgi:hypothetical protein
LQAAVNFLFILESFVCHVDLSVATLLQQFIIRIHCSVFMLL